jgi:hypothetical protein
LFNKNNILIENGIGYKLFYCRLKKMILKNRWHYNFKCCRWWAKIDKNDEKVAIEKSRRFGVFWVRFWPNLSKKGPIGNYGKTAPTKSTVLGARPPPINFNKFYRFLPIFTFFGPSIEPGKPSPKSASTANPPRKVVKNWYFTKI